MLRHVDRSNEPLCPVLRRGGPPDDLASHSARDGQQLPHGVPISPQRPRRFIADDRQGRPGHETVEKWAGGACEHRAGTDFLEHTRVAGAVSRADWLGAQSAQPMLRIA